MELLERHFEIALETPDGIKKLRELILSLAMQGKLVPQDPSDQPASDLLKEIEAEKKKLIKEGKIKKQELLPPIKDDEIPFALPKGWEWVRLDTISEYIQRGKGPKYSEIKEIPVISQKCIQWSGFNKDVVKFIEPESLDSYQNERFVVEGDLLWNSTGTGTIGRINIYSNELKNFQRVVVDSHVTVVRALIVNKEYLLKFLMSPIVQRDLEANASGTTNQIELNTSMVKNQLVPLPPRNEQKRIVEKIYQLMGLCDKLEAERNERNKMRLTIHTSAIDKLLTVHDTKAFYSLWSFITKNFDSLYSVIDNVADFKKAILQLAVMGKLVPQSSNDLPASELLKEIEAEKKKLTKAGKIKKQEPLPPIKDDEIPFVLPQGWEWIKLNEIHEFMNGFAFKSNTYVPYSDCQIVRLGNVKNNFLPLDSNPVFIPQEVAEERYQYELKEYDILITMTGTKNKRDYCFTTIIKKSDLMDKRLFLNQRVGCLRFYNPINIEYMNLVFKADFIINYLLGTSTGTANQANIGVEAIKNMVVPLPPINEQRRIVEKVNQLIELCNSLEQQIKNSTDKQSAIFDAVLAKLEVISRG